MNMKRNVIHDKVEQKFILYILYIYNFGQD